jgi:cell division protein FtsB
VEQVRQFVQRVVQGRRMLGSAFLALLAVALLAHVLFGNNGWLSYRQKRAESRKLQTQLQQMNDENQRLDTEIKALKSDPKEIEKEAREQLHYAKPGEVIYLLPEAPGQHASPSSPDTEAARR